MAVQIPRRKQTDLSQPHAVEFGVRRRLLADPAFSVSSFVVRRIRNGVCFEDVGHVHVDNADVTAAARQVVGMKEVQNHLLICKDDC